MSGDRGEKQTPSLVLFYTLVFFVLLLDQLTKFVAIELLPLEGTIPVIPGVLHWTLVYNTGIAFGFFREHQDILFSLITASMIALFFWSRRYQKSHTLLTWTFALVLGGAISNWIDRLRFRAVIDFIDFRVWPVFNLADSAITIGVALCLLALVRKKS